MVNSGVNSRIFFFTINLNTVSDPSLSWSQFNHKNIRRHTAYAIVSWPDPKQCMFNSSYFRYDDDNKTKYIFSQSSQGKWANWKHTASYSVQWITEKMCPILHTRQNISDTLLKRIPCRGLTGRDNSRLWLEERRAEMKKTVESKSGRHRTERNVRKNLCSIVYG